MATSIKTIRIGLWAVVGLALFALAYVQYIAPRLNVSIADTLGQGDYVLQRTDGQAFTQASLRGAPSIVFFGFTHCPEVCPTTLGDIATWQDELGTAGEKIRVFFITVDPEQDTLDILRDYVSWVPGIVGVTGTRAEIDKANAAFKVYARRVETDDGYTMDHSASVLLFDKNGRLFEPIGYQEGDVRALDKLRRLLAQS